jgi:murein DD-endopeptidase MepM/ murein hydrolase activator NlpD
MLIFCALVVLAVPGIANASVTGGTEPVEATAPVSPGGSGAVTGGGGAAGGTSPDSRPAPATPGATGGNGYGRPFMIPPVIRGFSASPRAVTWGDGPTSLRFRVDSANLRSVRVVLEVRAKGSRTVSTVALGSSRTGRTVVRRWTREGIDPGTYFLALRVVDSRGRSLARAANATITVRVRPKPKPSPAPDPAPAPAPAPSANGVFPVRGPVVWGDGYGVMRGDHKHNGQDLAADEGTPLVSPRRGTVFATGFGGAAGYYVVVKDAERDVSYVFFHMQADSVVVSEGQAVAAGQRIGAVGSTGRSTGPHLHFEVWLGTWWGGGHSVDPAPYLRGWL